MINGQKYHVSKNLVDISTYTASGQASKYEYFGNVTLSAGTYTFSCKQNNTLSSATRNTLFVVIDSNFTYESTATDYHLNVGLHSLTFTLESKKTIMLGYWTNTLSNDCIYDEFMLNAGSTAKPYEPYTTDVWHDTPIPTRKFHNKTDTLTSLPVDLYTDGQSASADIIGNMSQTGTPTPASPITPSECGERTENLCSGTTNINKTINSVTVTSDALGNFTVTGVASGAGGRTQKISDNISLSAGSYRVSLGRTTTVQVCISKASDNTFITSFYNSGSFTIYSDTTVYFGLNFVSGNSYNDTFAIMLQPFSTDYPYEPYGYKLDIKTGSTTTPVYLGEITSTRKIKKLVLTGDETYYKDSGGESMYYIYVNPVHAKVEQLYCTHLPSVTDYPRNSIGMYTPRFVNSLLYFNVGIDIMNAQTSGNTVEGLKEYLASEYANGTPVTVWYIRETETTGIVNEPIRKIGDYADSVSVTGIPTTAGGIEFDVDTTLKPSEVDLTYHGWHDISPKSKSANLFDKNATPYSTTGFITIEGTLTEYANWSVSDYIEVSANTQYTISGMNTTAVYASLCYYTEDKTYISGVRYNSALEVTFTTPTNCKFVLVSYHNSKINNVMLNTGSTALPYAPYWE